MDSLNFESGTEQRMNVATITLEDSVHSDDGTNSVSNKGSEIACDLDLIEEGTLNITETTALEDKELPCGKDELFVLTFNSHSVFQEIGHTVLTALQTALQQDENELIDIVCTPTESGVSLHAFRMAASTSAYLEVSEVEDDRDNEEASTSKASLANQSDKESSPDLTGIKELFTIDTEPAIKLDAIQVPSYKRSIKDVLSEESAEKRRKTSENECKRVRSSASCFNCGSTEHSMRDCPKPRNVERIAKAMKGRSTKQERYHVDVEQRFAHLRPGALTDNARSALDLKPGELPFFFYRMRVLGYPPGWLEEARVSDSGITLFNSEGNAVQKPDEDEGELDVQNVKYDVSKIVDFPGFNVDPGENFFDDYEHHNVPPMDPGYLKEEFIKNLGNNVVKGYKRKKLFDIETGRNEACDTTANESADMEIEDSEIHPHIEFSRPMPPVEAPPEEIPPPPPKMHTPSADESSSSVTEERSQSPTLEDLEAKQLKLLQELQANVSNLTEPTEDSLIDDVLALETTQDNIAEDDSATKSKEEEEEEPVTPKIPNKTSLATSEKGDVFKESHMGTPLLKFSPFEKLPDGEKFKTGVSDVIYFENLPDSTGKYEQMKKVIRKVRSVMTTAAQDA